MLNSRFRQKRNSNAVPPQGSSPLQEESLALSQGRPRKGGPRTTVNTASGSRNENHPDDYEFGGFSNSTSEVAKNMSITTISTKTKAAALTLRSTREQPTLQNYGNDYSDVFVHTGLLPQTWVQNATEPFKGYPKLQRLHDLKHKQYLRSASPAIGLSCPEHHIKDTLYRMNQLEMQFDVIMVHGCIEAFPLEHLRKLPLELVAARPSLLFLWVPATKIAEGRELMEKWGFRRGEDITYIVSSLESQHAPMMDSWHSDESVFRPTTWHCLMGLKGTLRRSTNSDLIHCNVNTDVIIEKPNQPASIVPEEIYSLVENFTSMKRKIHVLPMAGHVGLPVRPRQGWIVLSPDTFSVGSLDPAEYRERSTLPSSREIDLLRPQTPPSLR